MKKKIILILSMLSLLVCIFAVSVSASELAFVCPDEFDVTSANYNGSFSYNSSEEYEGFNGRLYYLSMYNSDLGAEVYFFEPNSFKSLVDFLLSKDGDATYQEWFSYCESIYNDSNSTKDQVCYAWGSYSAENSFLNEAYFNKLYNYKPITAENLTDEYNKGKTDGVTEFKSSEEYTTALDTKYQAGISDFKDSAEYKSSLNNAESNGYTLGMSAGKEAFKASDEYQNALDNQYTLGFNDGTVSAEENVQANVFGILFGVAGIGLLALSIVFVIFSAKKKVRSKR